MVVYIARVRITVQAQGSSAIREGHGSGEGRGTSAAEVHDIAVKAAETDATKRALATFGKPFGLELYRSGKAAVLLPGAVAESPAMVPDQAPARPDLDGGQARSGFHPDDTTPISRPSRYYGRRQGPTIDEHFRNGRRQLATRPAAPPLAPVAPAAPSMPDL